MTCFTNLEGVHIQKASYYHVLSIKIFVFGDCTVVEQSSSFLRLRFLFIHNNQPVVVRSFLHATDARHARIHTPRLRLLPPLNLILSLAPTDPVQTPSPHRIRLACLRRPAAALRSPPPVVAPPGIRPSLPWVTRPRAPLQEGTTAAPIQLASPTGPTSCASVPTPSSAGATRPPQWRRPACGHLLRRHLTLAHPPQQHPPHLQPCPSRGDWTNTIPLQRQTEVCSAFLLFIFSFLQKICICESDICSPA